MPEDDAKPISADVLETTGMRTVIEQAQQVTAPDDVQVSREQDHHDKDIESRDMQLWLAKIVILCCLALGAISMIIGVFTKQQTAIQLGMSLLSTILGVVLGFMFKR
ncbi:hypothetical protein [Roseobacter sp. N2S]|uniref:hypothetical protein n=1 Tax=Roseobacter sp. N2S TaxID=2663844 RepID=UPI002864FF51|nr:hypothetical protein [Roseobacter sp. N2S]MDR6265277.1 hypothetical protein [Roseobacter sp. N2S]